MSGSNLIEEIWCD